jgi:hypothetical protein
LDPAKYQLPEPYPYKEAAAFFKQPEVTPADQLPPMKWSSPDVEGLVAFLVGECDDTSRPGTPCSVTLLTMQHVQQARAQEMLGMNWHDMCVCAHMCSSSVSMEAMPAEVWKADQPAIQIWHIKR